MAEVFAALGAASCFLQIVDFTAKLASATVDLVSSGRDAVQDNVNVEKLAKECQSLGEECSRTATLLNRDGIHHNIIKAGKDCQNEAKTLLDELERLKLDAGGSSIKRWLKGTQQAARAIAHRDRIERHRRRLQELTNLLATQIVLDLWTRDSPLARHVGDSMCASASLVEGVQLVIARKQIDNVLESLKFQEMPFRERAIETAWEQTYSWAVEDSSNGLASWLKDGHGIFWISGKAGSGKSTLMKYLYDQKNTRTFLHEWSGDRRLIHARFFFWYAGTHLQKSITGLLKSILYQIFFEVPSLASVVLPQKVTSLEPIEWTDQDLHNCLETITLDPQGRLNTSKTAFCFFIDGLDEYEGDHSRLTNLLLAFASCSNLKICVSSRPWNAFVAAFEKRTPNLLLETLTKLDIKRYTSDRIQQAVSNNSRNTISDTQDSQEISHLVCDITDRAEGVFLWVVLAVNSVCEGMTEGDNIAMLRYRVSCFPQDLDEFFRSILRRVHAVYKHQTYQALKLAWMWTGLDRNEIDNVPISTANERTIDPRRRFEQLPTSFLDYWLIKQNPEGLADPEFAFTGEVVYILKDAYTQMCLETRKFLSASCKDLLYLPTYSGLYENGDPRLNRADRVEFLHRTVYDFLSTPEMQKTLNERVPAHFKDSRILHLLNLKRLKYVFGETYSKWHTLQHSAAMSLTTIHEDLHERYVDQFDDIAKRYDQDSLRIGKAGCTLSGMGHAEAMASLIAFQKHRWISAIINISKWESSPARGPTEFTIHKALSDRPSKDLVWTAVLGGSSIKQFPLEKVDMRLVEGFLKWISLGREGFEPQAKIQSSSSAWQIFLQRWKMEEPPHHSDAASLSDRWRHVWNIAKLILEDEDWDDHFSSEGLCQWECAGSINHILNHVPDGWVKECEVLVDHMSFLRARTTSSAHDLTV